MSVAAIEKLLRRRRPGESVAVHAFRRDELITTELTLAPAPDDTCWLTLDAKSTRRRRRAEEAGSAAKRSALSSAPKASRPD
jgi:predicted metalloprotease with PDZ domain